MTENTISPMSLNELPPMIGRLVWQLWSLEWLLRCVLFCLDSDRDVATISAGIARFYAATPGNADPVNALTGYDSLRALIDRYNETAAAKIDPSIVELRDLLAHGRVCAQNPTVPHFSLVKFSRPDNNLVTVQSRGELTTEWLKQQLLRVGNAFDIAQQRLAEIMGPTFLQPY